MKRSEPDMLDRAVRGPGPQWIKDISLILSDKMDEGPDGAIAAANAVGYLHEAVMKRWRDGQTR